VSGHAGLFGTAEDLGRFASALLTPSSLAVIVNTFRESERGPAIGTWTAWSGISTVIGPLLGGFLVDSVSWRWIFYVNLPIGLLALAVIAAVLPARRTEGRPKIDYLGASLLAGGLAAIVLFTSFGGTTYSWGAPQMIVLIVLGFALLGLFVANERRAPEPILPMTLFRNRVFSVSGGVAFIVGLALFGAVTYLPLYLQNVKGHSPTVSGLLITPMMAGVLTTSIASGQLISRFGHYKPFPIAGTALMALGLGLLSQLHVGTSTLSAAAYMLVLGLGLGSVMQVLVLVAQNSVDFRNLGVATSASTLFRQVGGSIGVAIFGAVFSNGLTSRLDSKLPHGVHVPTSSNPATVKRLGGFFSFKWSLNESLFQSHIVCTCHCFYLLYLRLGAKRGATGEDRADRYGDSFLGSCASNGIADLYGNCHRNGIACRHGNVSADSRNPNYPFQTCHRDCDR